MSATADPLPNQATSGDSTAGSGIVTLCLIALNVLVFLIMWLTGGGFFQPTALTVYRWGGNFGPSTIGDHQWWRLLTSMFLHFGIIHLVMNMVILLQIGFFIEALSGARKFLLLYIVSGIGGGFAGLLFHPHAVEAGASGAIFGLYGALLAFILRHRESIDSSVLAPLRKGALIFLGYNLIYGLVKSEVDLAAHLGGLATGFLFGLVLIAPAIAAPEAETNNAGSLAP